MKNKYFQCLTCLFIVEIPYFRVIFMAILSQCQLVYYLDF